MTSDKLLKDMQGFIWINGQSVDWHDANIHVLTHGLHYGSSVFEGIRVYDFKPFKALEHMERLHHSAQCLGFKIEYSPQDLVSVTHEQIALNKIANGYVRPVAWRGTETLLIGGGSKIANVAIAVWESFEGKRQEMRERGSKMHISKWRKPNPDASPYTAKAASIYTLCTLAKNDATAAGFDDAVMLDSNGNITEGTTSNIFFIQGNTLITPLPDRFLNGITRQTLIGIARSRGYQVVETKVAAQDLEKIDAAFLTGTAIELMQINSIEQKQFTLNHPIYLDLSDAFSAFVKDTI